VRHRHSSAARVGHLAPTHAGAFTNVCSTLVYSVVTPIDTTHRSAKPEVAEDARTERASLDRSLASGVAWAGISRFGSQIATWIVTLWVARILAPSDYGVVASATIYIALLRMLTEFGLGTAIVAQRSLTERQIAQLGGLAFLAGLAAWALTAILAVPVSQALRLPQLERVLLVLGASTAVATLNVLPTALLQRRLDFKGLSTLEVLRAVVASGALLLFAMYGLGYWALVLNEAVASVVFAIALYWRTRYTLAWPKLREISASLRLSSEVMASRLAWYAYSNADLAIVSRRMGAAVLGDYSMAWTLTSLPSEKISSVIVAVTPGVFARVQNNDAELGRYFLLLVEGLAILLFPATVGIALVAPELVTVVLGEKWRGAVPLVQALGLFVAIRSIAPLCAQLLIARLRGSLVAKYAILMALVLPMGFLVGSRWGAVGVALTWTLLYPPLAYLQFWVTCREINLPMSRLWAVLSRPTLGVALLAIGVQLTRAGTTALPDVARLAIMVAVGVVTYSAFAALTMRTRLLSMLSIVRNRGR